VFDLYGFLRNDRDSRKGLVPHPADITLLFICSVAVRIGSLQQIGPRGKCGELDRLMLGRKKPSADTLGYALRYADVELLRAYNAPVIQKARRNEVHGTGTFTAGRCALLTAPGHARPNVHAPRFARTGPRNGHPAALWMSTTRELWQHHTLGACPECFWRWSGSCL
jgi:hypothetical protein